MLTGLPAWYRADGTLSHREIADICWTMVARLAGAGVTMPEREDA